MEIKTRGEIREEHLIKIENIKRQAKNDIARTKYEMKMQLSSESDQKAIQKIKNKETRRVNKEEAKKEEQKKWENVPKIYSTGEEIFNSVTHGIGAGLAVAALVLLIIRAALYAPQGLTAQYVTSWTIFGATLVILYMMSTLYHALTPPKAKAVFAIFDHCAIYLLIAGTYTPFCIASLNGVIGWTLFGIIWGLAILGITMYSIFGKKIRIISLLTYIAMGWLIVFAYKPMKEAIPSVSLVFLLLGGAAYTLGVIFYAMKKVKWMHPIWHLFVLAGSILHFFSVYYSI